jgi:hypothetical protein
MLLCLSQKQWLYSPSASSRTSIPKAIRHMVINPGGLQMPQYDIWSLISHNADTRFVSTVAFWRRNFHRDESLIGLFSHSPNAYLWFSASGGWDIPRLCDGDTPLCVTSKLHGVILRIHGHLSKLLDQIQDDCDARNPTEVETRGSHNLSSTNIG